MWGKGYSDDNTLRLLGKAKTKDHKYVCHLVVLGSPRLEMGKAVAGLIPVGRVSEQV